MASIRRETILPNRFDNQACHTEAHKHDKHDEEYTWIF
ncbi:hypothetical protein DES49_1352 [Halospina denitrificans]|uniref:Uncharacterized protein n=1 Tax=Halospina denitrificans TaxID=332522 RepID=A0A4R7JZW4_9GAMM|nr:hypothetical protein DES49_1352 [Halospina denitrificans]